MAFIIKRQAANAMAAHYAVQFFEALMLIMARLAKALQVSGIKEKLFIAFMWLHMIHNSSCHCEALRFT